MSSDEPKPTILDAKAFLDWVKSKPRGDMFTYVHISRCAVSQFLQARHPGSGVNCGSTFATVWDARGTITKRYNMPPVVVDAFKRLTIQRRGRYSFGELAKELEDEMLAADGV